MKEGLKEKNTVYFARSKNSSPVYVLSAPYPLCAFKNDLRHQRGQMKTSTWELIMNTRNVPLDTINSFAIPW